MRYHVRDVLAFPITMEQWRHHKPCFFVQDLQTGENALAVFMRDVAPENHPLAGMRYATQKQARFVCAILNDPVAGQTLKDAMARKLQSQCGPIAPANERKKHDNRH
jgi:hypothetical protein